MTSHLYISVRYVIHYLGELMGKIHSFQNSIEIIDNITTWHPTYKIYHFILIGWCCWICLNLELVEVINKIVQMMKHMRYLKVLLNSITIHCRHLTIWLENYIINQIDNICRMCFTISYVFYPSTIAWFVDEH